MSKSTTLFALIDFRRDVHRQTNLTICIKSLALRSAFLAFIAFVFPTNLMAQSFGCDPSYVDLKNGVLNVAPTGIDDTTNIQCALDAAKANGVPAVKLGKSDYFISHIQISGFRGTLEGTTKDDTTLVVLNNSVDCDGLIDAGQTPSGIKFIEGDARVRFLTYGADTPCIGEQSDVFFLIHFTGGNAYSDCANDTGFGVVDRVNLVSLAPLFPGIRGVGAGAEGTYFGTCKDTLLGTFKLNRSLLGGMRVAAQLGIRGAGQVDINFNDFVDNGISVAAFNANQLLTVQENVIVRSEDAAGDFFGVALLTSQFDAPTTNRLVLHGNEFMLEAGSNVDLNFASFAGQDLTIAGISLVATKNKFLLMGNETWGFAVTDISGGIFANNDMDGVADLGFIVGGDEATSRDWSVTGNSFHGLNSGSADIVLDYGSAETIVGPGQGNTILDIGSGNIILNSGNQKLQPTAHTDSQVINTKASSILPRLRQLRENMNSLLISDSVSKASADPNSAQLNDLRPVPLATDQATSISSAKNALKKMMGSSLRED